MRPVAWMKELLEVGGRTVIRRLVDGLLENGALGAEAGTRRA
jgi:hypothetical protein